MRIIKPNAEVMKHDCGVYEFIEKVGRVCYKSEDKIGEGTAEKFVNGLVKNQHYGILEHEYLYFYISDYNDMINFMSDYIVPDGSSYNITKYLNISDFYVSGSVRAWKDFFDNLHRISKVYDIGYEIYAHMELKVNILYPDLFPLFDKWDHTAWEGTEIELLSRDEFIDSVVNNYAHPEKVFEICLPHTVRFITNRGVMAEITRHRDASFAVTSTRYVNYGHDKHGKEITVIEPSFFAYDDVDYKIWKIHCEDSERSYMALVDNGAKPEEARSVLPNSLMTEIILTATEKEWQHILNLRWHGTTGRPHPEMEELMDIAAPLLIEETGGRVK